MAALKTGAAGFVRNHEEEENMRDFSIDIVWAKLQMGVSAVGGWLGYFLGGMDGLLIALVVFMALDYVTRVMCAI